MSQQSSSTPSIPKIISLSEEKAKLRTYLEMVSWLPEELAVTMSKQDVIRPSGRGGVRETLVDRPEAGFFAPVYGVPLSSEKTTFNFNAYEAAKMLRADLYIRAGDVRVLRGMSDVPKDSTSEELALYLLEDGVIDWMSQQSFWSSVYNSLIGSIANAVRAVDQPGPDPKPKNKLMTLDGLTDEQLDEYSTPKGLVIAFKSCGVTNVTEGRVRGWAKNSPDVLVAEMKKIDRYRYNGFTNEMVSATEMVPTYRLRDARELFWKAEAKAAAKAERDAAKAAKKAARASQADMAVAA